MNIPAPERHGAALVTQQQQREEMANFSFRNVVQRTLNFSYYPRRTGKYTTSCINVTTLPGNEMALSFYTLGYPEGWSHVPGCGKTEEIQGRDLRHTAKLHKRQHSWVAHCHVSVKPEDCDAFLRRVLEIIDLFPDDHSRLKLTAWYLSEYQSEPGLSFDDGSYAENGGARSMYDIQRNRRYFNGPLKEVALNPASVAELNALPGQDET